MTCELVLFEVITPDTQSQPTRLTATAVAARGSGRLVMDLDVRGISTGETTKGSRVAGEGRALECANTRYQFMHRTITLT